MINNNNDDMFAIVKEFSTADVSRWSDSHILNFSNTLVEKFREYFSEN